MKPHDARRRGARGLAGLRRAPAPRPFASFFTFLLTLLLTPRKSAL